MKNNSHSVVANMSTLIDKKSMDGREYLVCPAILINEGVHNGVFYPAEELAKFPEAWNGRPVPVGHPVLSGKSITANSPDIIEKQVVGQLFDTRFEDKKLKAEVWIDLLKAKASHPEILSRLSQNQKVEVSTGLFTDDEVLETEADWNGEKYWTIARNHRPDHLALLLDGVGSCSWADGAGMPRTNKEAKMENDSQALFAQQPDKKTVNPQKKLQEDDVERKEVIDKLIGHKVAEEADREHLEKVSVLLWEKLEKVLEVLEEEAAKEDEGEDETVLVNKAKTVQEYADKAPAKFRPDLLEGLKLNTEKRNALIEVVKANKANKFTVDELQGKSTDELGKLFELAKVVASADFSVSGSSFLNQNQDDKGVPDMPKLDFSKK